MTTYAHVTVIVVEDGVTTTYDIPKVDKFATGIEREAPDEHDTLSYGPLESSATPRVKALTFSMRPLRYDDNGTVYTYTQSA